MNAPECGRCFQPNFGLIQRPGSSLCRVCEMWTRRPGLLARLWKAVFG